MTMSKRGDDTTRGWLAGIDAVRQFLSRSDFLKDVPGEVLDKLARLAIPRGLKQGDKLWSEGDNLYFVIVWRGQIEVRKDGGLIDIMLASQAFGHSALLGKMHTAAVSAAVDSHVLCFDAARVFDLARDSLPLMIAVLADVLALVSKLNGDLCGSKGPLRKRLRHRLSWLSRGRKHAQIDITHKQLAELTGSTHFSVSRELKQMEEAGALRRGFKVIEIIDLDLDNC